jgi:flagellar M-ring protein FliF
MAPDLRNVTAQTRALWERLPPLRRVILMAVLAASFIGLGLITMESSDGYTVLFSGLPNEDAGAIVAQLDAEKVPYRLENSGGTILVPESQVHKLRLSLAANGMPSGGGIGFEVFEKQTFGTTSFVERMNYRRALQGELQRTIATLSVVESSRVHIAIQERSLYKDDDEPPSASVVLKLKRGRALSRSQSSGIVHLVASSVEGLQPDRVTIIDDAGNVLSSGDREGGSGNSTHHDLERSLEKRILSILEPVVGSGHVAVTVTAEIDQSQIEKTEELYDPQKLTLRSEQRTVEGEGAAGSSTGGLIGARGNLPNSSPLPDAPLPAAPTDPNAPPTVAAAAPTATPPPASTTTTSTKGLSRLSETRNFEVNRVVSRMVGAKSRVKRLHVAVLVDGVPRPIDPAAAAKPAAEDPAAKDKEKGKEATEEGAPAVAKVDLIPRIKEELTRIESLAREAAGLDPERGDRIEVHSVPFVTATTPVEEDGLASHLLPISPRLLVLAIAGLGLLVLGVLSVFMLRNKKAKGLRAELIHSLPARVSDLEAALPAGDDAARVLAAMSGGARTPPGLPEQSARDRAVQSVKADAGRAARVLAQWVGEPAESGGAKR